MAKLTKTLVDKAEAASKDVWLWDDEVPGFGVRVQPSGRKTYVVRYRTQDSVQRKQTIGRCTDMHPDKARDLARKVFTAVAEGRDPAHEKAENRAALTLAELADRYNNEHAAPFKKPRSAERDRTNWRLHILPVLGKKKVKNLTQEDVLGLVGGLSVKPATANQCLALMSKAMNLAEIWKIRPQNSNPCRGIKKYKLQERETILSPKEITRMFEVMDRMVLVRDLPPTMRNLVKLLCFTGARLTEIMHAERAWVDEDRSLLLLPDSKVGQRRIPLSPAAMEIINKIPAQQKWLIPGRRKNAHMTAPYKHWSAIKEQAGLPEEMRIHDLRHTAGSLAHSAGMSQKQIAMMLGHRQLSTTERYLHGLKGDDARAMDVLASVITQNPQAAELAPA